MSDPQKVKEFPSINNKLSAPGKKSVFERQKAESEAKKAREAAETAAAYEDFVKSFEDQDDNGIPHSNAQDRFSGNSSGSLSSRGGFGGARRFAPPNAVPGNRSTPLRGVGSLGPALTPLSKKRTHDGSQTFGRETGLFAFENSASGNVDTATAFPAAEDDEDSEGAEAEKVAPKPTLQLSSLPPGTSPAVIKSLLPPNLTVDAVRIMPPSGPGSLERKSMQAIVTLAMDTPANDIDNAVNTLQNRYLGYGYYLSLSRHLSSAALNTGSALPTNLSSTFTSLPFGAKAAQPSHGLSLGRAPPPNSIHRGGYAPPSSYEQGRFARPPPVQVYVKPPADLKELKLIHKTLESILTHGPEFEALLMSRPEVQRDEKWAWIWDPRSSGGVWYRWRLWEILSGSESGSGFGKSSSTTKPNQVFEGAASWMAPEKGLRFQYLTDLEEFVSDKDYDSSEDENSDEEEYRRQRDGTRGLAPDGVDNEGSAFLNPLKRAKLAHLLARLPSTNARLRKGDVARITAFAIQNAGHGSDEVVDMIVSNIEMPFSCSTAKQHKTLAADVQLADDEDEQMDDNDRDKDKEDNSTAKLVGLYLISDILSSSSTSGVRHAWRYRQLFETSLKERKIFEHLGRLERELSWGRLRAEKWKRSVGGVLSLWEGWCVFPQSSQEHFAAVFSNPPLNAAEEAAAAATQNAMMENASAAATKSKWKSVEKSDATRDENGDSDDRQRIVESRASSHESGDVDGEFMMEDDDVDGEPMEDIDGEPMAGSESDGVADVDDVAPIEEPPAIKPVATAPPPPSALQARILKAQAAIEQSPSRKPRPKAVDMFADSDDDGTE